MKRAWAWVAAGLISACCRAEGVGRLAEVSLIDRDRGISLPIIKYQGEYWVAGTPGAHYAIDIVNHGGGRLLAVTSVDGINVLSGANAAWNQSGYVFEPGEGYQILGWRKSDQQVAAFLFTASPNSYAGRTGRPANIGVIGVAVFREREPVNRSRDASENAARAADAALASAPRAKLGTGHGDREYSYVSHTEFDRLDTRPYEVIRIHYDSSANLISMGIIHADPFPGSPESSYVPDPPG